jgi:hypothetical protein
VSPSTLNFLASPLSSHPRRIDIVMEVLANPPTVGTGAYLILGWPIIRPCGPFRRRRPKGGGQPCRCQCKAKLTEQPSRTRRRCHCGRELQRNSCLDGVSNEPWQKSMPSGQPKFMSSGPGKQKNVPPREMTPIQAPTLPTALTPPKRMSPPHALS